MERTIRKYASYKAIEADEYRHWQSRPGHERMDAVSELTTAAYALNGMAPDVPRFQAAVSAFHATTRNIPGAQTEKGAAHEEEKLRIVPRQLAP
jgi:hypothetical protein